MDNLEMENQFAEDNTFYRLIDRLEDTVDGAKNAPFSNDKAAVSRNELNEIIEVNGLLEEKGLNFKVHLRDACGKQSCWIEPLGNCACEGRYEEMYQVVEEYFRRKGQKITFDETKLNFFAV